MSKRTRATRLRRTWPQRMLITFNCGCIVIALVAAGSLAYAKKKVSETNRYKLDNIVSNDQLADTDPRNFLIVGADSDDGLALDDPTRFGRDDGSVGGVRSDTIMVVRLDPATNQAKVLSFPRDLWVDIPGEGHQRINASLQFGGQDLLIETIKANYDIDINHYVQVDFAGFKKMVKLLDGMPIYFATPTRDTQSGLNIETAGCHRLDENSALDYVRSRHMRFQDENGEWESDPTSDLGRISRQQDFIKRVMRRAISQGARNPNKLRNILEVGLENIHLDQATTAGDLIDLGIVFKDFKPDTLETYSLPVERVFRGGADVLDLQSGLAEPILAKFRGTGAEAADGTVSPAAVSVQVLNGSGIQDQASDASAVLGQAGFRMTPPNSTGGVPVTEIRYVPGQQAAAHLVARYLFAPVVYVEDRDVSEIVVVTGENFGAALAQPRPDKDVPAPTTTTTTAPDAEPSDPGSGSSTTGADNTQATTTTTAPNGFVPPTAPEGVECG